MAHNPFLPKRPIRWQAGPAKGTLGIPVLSAERSVILPLPNVAYHKDPRGRKPKDKSLEPPTRKPVTTELHEAPAFRTNPEAGKLNFCTGSFLSESNSGWGANLDMIGLAHGPVGCGSFAQSTRLNLPGFMQGVESFTALHACTDCQTHDLDDGGDAKLSQSLNELSALFPLARGVTILSEDPIMLVDANIKGIAKTNSNDTGRLVIPPFRYGHWDRSAAAAI